MISDLQVFPLCLGGNVFGRSADAAASFRVLDAYAASGGISSTRRTATSSWVAGHGGGESETVIGKWMAARGNRSRMIVATKVGRLAPHLKRLAARTVRTAAENSQRRLAAA